MLKHYGYEDYEGNLSDFLKNQNSLNSCAIALNCKIKTRKEEKMEQEQEQKQEQKQTKKLGSNKSIEKEIKQYIKLINGKTSKYYHGGVADMKSQLLLDLCSDAYSDEQLECLKEVAKVIVLDVNEDISVGTPMWNALNVAIFTLFATLEDNNKIWYISIYLLLLILSISLRKNNILKRIGFYTMLLELIEKAEQNRGHSFYESLKIRDTHGNSQVT